MDMSVSEAKGQLTELVRRAEDGEEIILTRHGKPVVRLQPLQPSRRGQRKALLEAIRRQAPPQIHDTPTAARSQDFLYDDDGLPS
ncbi:type II toxin-antitoxin system Phd/YefM family antitoxin [Brevundimonas sp. VNH65]|uniref:type II toxin-antitoxin system Phd/YefM family antitoxin n=1 Tax=Brevundimonas sp. VNH65 TaxID=3400917 RepID=UPI003C0EB4EC